MARWSKVLAGLGHSVEGRVDSAKYSLRERYGDDALTVLAYLNYGTAQKFYLHGRVLEDKGVTGAGEQDAFWHNLKNAYRRFESDEIAGAKVRAYFRGAECEMVTNEEGFFQTWLELSEPLEDDHDYLQEVDLELLCPKRKSQEQFHFVSEIIVPADNASFGIISDMDDTVLQTGAHNTLSMIKKVLFGNARTRLPFEGVAAFYEALNRDKNPLFYVSSSPWNLYDVLIEFLELNDIPLGPLTLRDWGLTPDELLPTSHGDHKMTAIRQLLDTYPHLPFILIGDSGQEDPEIYAETVHTYPERILCVYIRDVSERAERDKKIQSLGREIEKAGSTLVLAQNTLQAAEHAAGRGWISEEDVARVARRRAEDEQKPKA